MADKLNQQKPDGDRNSIMLQAKSIEKLIKNKVEGRYSDGGGLYLRVRESGSFAWELRYTLNGKRKAYTLPQKATTEAREEATRLKKLIREDKYDPIAESKRVEQISIKSVNDLFTDWHKGNIKSLKHHEIPKRYYEQKIKPFIGELAIAKVRPLDIKSIIDKEAIKGFNTSSNKILIHAKQLFNHAIKLGLITANPAIAFKNVDAGGKEAARERALSINELKDVFRILKENSDQFTRENYLAIILLLCLGVRKSELLFSEIKEFDFENKTWNLPGERTKTGNSIKIPISNELIPFFEELKVRSCDSNYLFPNRRKSKRFGHVSADTLNHALTKLFKQNKFVSIPHFTVHDLRRTCRSLLSEIGVAPHIAERCLNHKLKGVLAIYDKHDFFEERKISLSNLASYIFNKIET